MLRLRCSPFWLFALGGPAVAGGATNVSCAFATEGTLGEFQVTDLSGATRPLSDHLGNAGEQKAALVVVVASF